MRKNSTFILGCALVLAVGTTATVWAELSPDEIAKLGNELTPMGAIKAGNEDGTIPAWEGGLATPPAAWKPDTHYIDPFADDEVLFTITAANMDQYADKLTEGQKALLTTYPDTYKMNVYPTRRSAAYPQRIYDKTREIAATARLTEGGNGVTGAINGIPFPIPKQGVEVIWNHLLRYRADSAARTIGQAAPTRGGSYTLVTFRDEFYMQYSMEGKAEADLNNRILFFKQEVMAPARLAGGILLVGETLDQVKEHRNAWLYNPGQRRVRRAPNVAYDNPGTAADAMRTSDQFDMYNGAGREKRDLRPVQLLQAAGPIGEVQRHPDAAPHQPGFPALRTAPGVGRGFDPQGGRPPHLQTSRLLPRRGLLADRRCR
jgi:hypothetical protein